LKYTPIHFDNKKCLRCNTVKSITSFNKNKSKKDGLSDWCKLCIKEYNKEYNIKNKDKLAVKNKEWRDKNREIIAIKDKRRRKRDAKKIAIRRRKYREKNAKWLSDKSKEHYKLHKDRILKSQRAYYKRNSYKIKKVNAKYRKNNVVQIRVMFVKYRENNAEKINTRTRNRYHNDEQYKLAHSLRTYINLAVKSDQKAGSAVRDLGCSIEFLKEYLESQFYSHSITGKEMTWDSRGSGPGTWQIHHIKFLSSFDLTIREQFLIACHHTNLQPLWYEDHVEIHTGANSVIFNTPYNQPQEYAFY